MKNNPAEKYIEKVKLLTAEELEIIIARMHSDLRDRMERGKLSRKLSRKLSPLEASAIQLEIEADQVREWRTKWARQPVGTGMTESVAS